MSQVALRALDAWSAREWREKERGWRAEKTRWREEEMAFRAEERRIRHLERLFLDRQLRHRDEDIRQRRVDNSRYLWCRFAELNRLDVGEKSEQLRSLSWLTALIASFTFTSPVEFSYGSNYISTARLTAYAICAAVVPSLMTISSILCMYLLGSILKMGKWFVAELPEEEFMAECREYAETSGEKGAPPAPRRTFERFWDCRCEDDWKTSFRLFVCGISSFLALLCTMAFIKFSFNNLIAILFSAVIAVFFFLWLGAQVTWGSYLMTTQADSTSSTLGYRLRYLSSENPFKWHLCPVLRSELTDLVSDSAQAEDTEGELLIQDNPEALPI